MSQLKTTEYISRTDILSLFEEHLMQAGISDPLRLDLSFPDVGGDSLVAVELVEVIRSHTGVDIPIALFFEVESVQMLLDEIMTEISR